MANKTKKKEKTSSHVESASLPAQSGASLVTAIVGLVIGGPVGAMAGAAAGPFVNKAASIIENSIRRRSTKVEKALQKSFAIAGLSLEDFEIIFSDDPQKEEDFISLLTLIFESDEELSPILTAMLSELIAPKSLRHDRLMLLVDSLRDLRAVHMRILQALGRNANKSLSASDLAQCIDIPEIELRPAVHLLESRGMIKDQGVRPVIWQLRELGLGLVKYIDKGGFKDEAILNNAGQEGGMR